MTEILNIEYHTIRLMVKALNIHKTHAKAAAVLGMDERTIYAKKRQHNIKRIDGKYRMPKVTFIVSPIIEGNEITQENTTQKNCRLADAGEYRVCGKAQQVG